MASNIANEIAAKVAELPPERQREALALIEQLAVRTTAQPHAPRSERTLKGPTAQGSPICEAEIREARHEMWDEHMGEDENRASSPKSIR